ncbi:hypothetical protein KO504_17260 [Winogradskyella psychrotolerans]|uniref:DUF6705 family protein n=1 Tax=Winogradskyella psychrotolerans TaxID=1344585 RepID=UPI001C06D5A2|nr:DUF6705 family protein [Winogradskyella psychrotolerans]MBU2923099.1 hypothetical protein [Winogradskyella psychrotolerans]
MKIITNIILLLIINYSFGQTIVPIEDRKTTIEVEGNTYYYKDVNGEFNKFLGDWKYQNNATNPTKIVEISFFKREMDRVGTGGYEDEIFARIKYTENDIIIYNTFPVLQPVLNTRDWNIFGGYFTDPTNTNKLKLGYYSEPGIGGTTGQLELNYSDLGNEEQLHWKVFTWRDTNEEGSFKMPYEMTLVKQ